jgi:hypothetical protein
MPRSCFAMNGIRRVWSLIAVVAVLVTVTAPAVSA